MEKKYFIKGEMRCQGSVAGEVFIDIGSIIVMENTANGIRVKLSNAGEDYYVKDWHRYTLDDVLEPVKKQDGTVHGRGGFAL